MAGEKEKMSAGKKAVIGIILILLVLTTGVYFFGVYYFTNHFLPGSVVGSWNCSYMTVDETEDLLSRQTAAYVLAVETRGGGREAITAEEAGLVYTSDGSVKKLMKEQDRFKWFLAFQQNSSYEMPLSVSFDDKEKLKNAVQSLKCMQTENITEPVDAYITDNGSQFEIVPETQGSKLQLKEAYKALDEAISGSQPSVDFNICENVYASADVVSTDPELQATVDAYNNFAQASITYTFGDQSETLDGTTIKDWLQFDEKGQLVKDDASFKQHVADFVAQLAATYDTVGTSRPFNTTNGRTVYVYGSAYGWKIDQAAEVEQLMQDIRSGTQTTRDPIYSMTANSHGYNDFGNTYIEVDLSYQHMYYYQDGAIIFDSDIVSGDMRYEDRQTPPGVFTLYYKKSPDVLRGQKKEDGTYEYETEVNFWMPFNGGIGFHDATWQPYFGGNRFMEGGSHGCINMPYSSAATLYSIIQYGVPIICFY